MNHLSILINIVLNVIHVRSSVDIACMYHQAHVQSNSSKHSSNCPWKELLHKISTNIHVHAINNILHERFTTLQPGFKINSLDYYISLTSNN